VVREESIEVVLPSGLPDLNGTVSRVLLVILAELASAGPKDDLHAPE
jgi:hypothetical protein